MVKSENYLRLIIFLIIMIFYWMMLSPLINSVDQFAQYKNALDSTFTDWHPPLMAIITSLLINNNFSFSIINLIQCLMLSSGVLLLIRKITLVITSDKKNNDLITFIVTLILISPFSPLPYRSVNWSIDTWFIISLVYLIYQIIDTFQLESPSKITCYYKAFIISVIGAIAMHFRYNAFILFPLICYSIFFTFNKKKFLRAKSILYILPIIIYLLINLFIKNQYHIEKKYHTNGIMFLDIIGLIVDNPEVINNFPYVKNQLEPFYKEKYAHGDLGPILWTQPLILKNSADLIYNKNKLLQNEYKKMILKHPIKLMLFKIKTWKNLLIENRYRETIIIENNNFELIQNKYFNSLRLNLNKVEGFIFSKMRSLYLTIRGNTIWFILNITFIIVLIYKQGIRSISINTIILLYPLLYYFSYLFASPGGGHRYVYPSILVIQIYMLVYFLNVLLNSTKKSVRSSANH